MSYDYDVFISYNENDQIDVEKIRDLLENKYHVKTWLDKWNLIPGQGTTEDIEGAIKKCSTFAILIGPKGIGDWDNEQMNVAIYIRSSDKSRRVIPVYLPGAPDESNLSLFLRRLTPVDFRNGKGLKDPNLLYQLYCGIKGLEQGGGLPKDITVAELEDRINVGIPDGSYIPFLQNTFFTGRTEILKAVEQDIFGNKPKPAVISGMGGVGKTQTAVEFAYRYGYRYRGVHWMNLDNPEMLDSEIAQCGRKMGISLEKQDEQVVETLSHWKKDGPRLVILDNFEQLDQVPAVLNRLAHANVRLLVTSRRADWLADLGVDVHALDSFTPQEALGFLRQHLGENEQEHELFGLAERLGFLPLALELAAKYLNVADASIEAYLAELSSSIEHESMQSETFEAMDIRTSTGHALDLRATFALSWQKVTDPIQQDIFKMAGYLAPNVPIPKNIFEGALEQKPIAINKALYRLYGLGLLRKSEKSEPSIHPLLAEYARLLSKGDQELLVTLADMLAALSSWAVDTEIPTEFNFIKAHILVFAAFAEDANLKKTGTILNDYGYHLQMVADYAGAQAAYERALKIDESNFDPDDPKIAIRLSNLGSVMRDLGDLKGAREALEQALKIDEANIGPDDPTIAIRVNNLGGVMQALGGLEEARAAFERALKIDEASFGPDHPSVARDVNNLGGVYYEQGNLDGARAAFERAMKIDEANLGEDHPNVATLVNNLGMVMKDQDDLPGARAAFERAIKIWEANLGTEHPQVATGVNNLAGVNYAQGDLHDARAAYERALKIFEKHLGENHPNVAVLVSNLGIVLRDLGDLNGAREALEHALAIFKNFLPPDHPNIKNVQENLDSLG
jgi:tetratricopeptide (TPR) repeat protein